MSSSTTAEGHTTHHGDCGKAKHHGTGSGLHTQAADLLSCSAGKSSEKHGKGKGSTVADATEHGTGEGQSGNPLHVEAVKDLSSRPAGRGTIVASNDALLSTGGGGPIPQQQGGDGAKPGDQKQGTGKKGDLVVPPLYGQGQSGAFDASKSVSDLMQQGKFKDATQGVSDQGYAKAADGQAPKVSVVYENKDTNVNPPPPQPNYIIEKDGSVKVVHNPEGNPPDANVVIQVQRDKGQTDGLTGKQQQAVNDLVNYEASRIQQQYADSLPEVQTANGPVKQVDINDPQALVADQTAQKFGDRIPPEVQTPNQAAPPSVPTDVDNTSNEMNRVPGSGGSRTIPRESAPGRQSGDPNSPAGIDQMIPPREVPQAPNEPKSMVSMKDVAAALFDSDRHEPYSTVKEAPGMGYRVGRYGMNHGFSLMGLAQMLGIDLGDPPDYSKLQEYLQQHPDAMQNAMHQYANQMRQDADSKNLPQDDKVRQTADNMDKFASKFNDPKFAEGFNKFLSDMKGGGDPITKERVNEFMPKEFQEALAQAGIDHLAKNLGADPSKLSPEDASKVALGMFLGRTPTQEDMNNPAYQRFSSAAANMFQLANARQDGMGDVNVSDAQGKIAAVANNDVGHALWTRYMSNGNLGCAASVSTVLQQAGFSYANSASVQGLEQQLLAHGWHMDSSPRAGDVVCGYRGGGHGHTGVIGSNGEAFSNSSSSGRWTRQSVGYWTRGHFSAGVHFLRPPGQEAA